MKQSATRRIIWGEAPIGPLVGVPPAPGATTAAASADLPRLDPMPASAEEEAVALLRIAAEVEGALVPQYLFSAGSLLPGISIQLPGFDHAIQSDDWYDLMRALAKQEMGHLITLQNLLLSLGSTPHLDRENFPTASPLYPFPFSLQPVRLATIARYVCAEAPRDVAAADQSDLADAQREAKVTGGQLPRAGQIYERLFYLFQDGDTPQDPWPDLQNPFPHWPDWHVDPAKLGFNQDRQATSAEWRGQGDDEPPDTAIYVLPINDKASARLAIHALGIQGEGPIGNGGVTHFDKCLRIFRELRAVSQQPGAPAFMRNQADDPRTGLGGSATISHPTTLVWAKLGNTRYQMLLSDIALSLSGGSTGTLASIQATRTDVLGWAFREMLANIKPLSEELRQMPLTAEAGAALAGLPFELPEQALPTDTAAQIAYLRDRVAESIQLRAQIQTALNPSPKQKGILKVIDNLDVIMSRKIGATAA
jgi:Ferritin-like